MKDFYEALASSERNAAIPKEDDFFGMLIGSWYIDYVDNATGAVRKGEWHFSRVLEGMAVQDVIVLPHFEYGTTLRMYNPATRTWEIAYGYTGRKWVFAKIAENHFHWQDIMVQQDGEWQVNYDLYAKRME